MASCSRSGDTRPGWKVLRVLGTMLKLPGFDADTAADVRASVLPAGGDVAAACRNATRVRRSRSRRPPRRRSNAWPTCRSISPTRWCGARRRCSCTADARPPKARMHRSLFETLGLADGAQVKVTQGHGEAVLTAVVDAAVPPGVVRIAAAHASTCGLEGLSGPVSVERA